MPIEHLSYSARGRNFRVLKDGKLTGQLCYKSQVGQENLLDHGTYVPYIKDEKAKTLTFKRSQIKLTATGIEFYIWDKKLEDYVLRTIASFHPEIKETTVWNRKTATATTLVWEDLEIAEGFTDKTRVSYTVSTADMDVKVNIEIGGSSRALFSFEQTSKVVAEQRLVWHTTEIEEAIPIQAVFASSKLKQTRTVGYRFRGYEIRWNYEEAVDRKAEGLEAEEETKIIIAEKNYVIGEVQLIKPDQWGETGVANTNDDCSENGGVDLDGYDSDGDVVGDIGAAGTDYYCRFQNVTIVGNPTSVDAGTQIEFDIGYAQSGSFNIPVYGLEGDTPDFNTTAPSTRTRTAASMTYASEAAGVDRVVDGVTFQAVVKEVLDTGWLSGYDIGFAFSGENGAGGAIQIEDYSTGTAARLTIVYTAAGGETLIVNSAESAGTIDDVSLTQAHTLAVQALTGAGILDNTDLTQANILAVQELLSAGSLDNVDLIQKHILAIQALTSSGALDNVDVVQAHLLVVQDLLSSGDLDNVDLIQSHLLVVQELLSSATIDNIELSFAALLVVADMLSSGTIDNVALIQKHVLVIQDSLSAGTVDNVTLSLSILLIVADALSAGAIDNVGLTQKHILAIQSLLSNNSLDNVSLTQKHLLVVNSLISSGTIDNIVLIFSTLLVVSDLLSSGTIENTELTQQHVLTVDEVLSAGHLDSVGLTQKHLLIIESLLSSGVIDNINFDIARGIIYISLTKAVEYNIGLSNSSEYGITLNHAAEFNIDLSKTGGGL